MTGKLKALDVERQTEPGKYARGVQSLGHSDCMEIVEKLLGRLKDLDRELAARSVEQR